MSLHHTKSKGDLGVMKVQCDLCEKGYTVLTPMTEHSPFDVVAYDGKNFHRMQVKYRKLNSSGCIEVPMRTCWADKHGTHMKDYDKDQIDYFAIYCPDTEKCYYVKSNDIRKNLTLRVNPPKNNQSVGVRYAKDYMHL